MRQRISLVGLASWSPCKIDLPDRLHSDTRLHWEPTAPKTTDLLTISHLHLVSGLIAISGRIGERTGGVGRVGRVGWLGWDGRRCLLMGYDGV